MQMINWFLKVKNKNTKSPVPEVQQEEDSESQNLHSAQVRGSENPCTYQAPQMLASPIKWPHTL